MIRLWAVATGKEIRKLPGDKDGTSSLAFSGDGRTFAAAGGDGVQPWEASTWQQKPRLTTGWTHSILLLPDGKTLVVGGEGIRWYDAGTGKETRRVDSRLDHIRRLIVSPDGKRLAAVLAPGTLYLWDAVTGEEINRAVLGPKGVTYLCFSPDSQTLACCVSVAGSRKDSGIRLFAANNGQETGRWDKGDRGDQICFSPDGKVLAQEVDGVILLRDFATGAPVLKVPRLPNRVMTVGFTPDGTGLIASCFGGHIGVWDPLTGKPLTPMQPPPAGFVGRAEMLLGAALTADRKYAALVDGKGVLHVWEPVTGKAVSRIADPPVGDDQAAFAQSGKLLVVKHTDGIIRVWESATGKLRCALPKIGQTRFPHPHAFSPDGSVLATAPASLDEGVIRLWDTATGKQEGWLAWEDKSRPTSLAFSPDGKYLVAAHSDHYAEVDGPGEPPEPSLRLWSLATGREVRRYKSSAGDIRSVVFSPDGKTLAAAAWDTVVLWEVASGKERGRFAGHQEWIWSVDFSPDGRLLASGSLDNTALVWDVTAVCPNGRWSSGDVRTEEIDRLGTDLGGADAAQAHRALWRMVAAPRQAVPYLAKRLRPAVPIEEKRTTGLIDDLDSADFDVRARATQELQNLGELAEPAMRKALAKSTSLEVRRRLERLLDEVTNGPLSAEQLFLLRSLEVLEHIGNQEARAVLESLTTGAPGVRLTIEAKASVDRLTKPAAAAR